MVEENYVNSYKPVLIVWRDSFSIFGWNAKGDSEEFLNSDPPLMESVGFLIQENKVSVVIAESVNENQYGNLLKIPAENIVEVIKLRREKK